MAPSLVSLPPSSATSVVAVTLDALILFFGDVGGACGMVAVTLDALITFTIEAALVGYWTAEQDVKTAVEESVDWGVAALAGRIGGLGGFGGAVACETVEPDYIWRCNITKIHPSFHLRDVQMGA
jgi:hypothetical protein